MNICLVSEADDPRIFLPHKMTPEPSGEKEKNKMVFSPGKFMSIDLNLVISSSGKLGACSGCVRNRITITPMQMITTAMTIETI